MTFVIIFVVLLVLLEARATRSSDARVLDLTPMVGRRKP